MIHDDKYILNGREIVAVDLMTWAKWFETANRVVKQTRVDDAEVSTVFLGIAPQQFETMVFGGALDEEQERCCTYDEAEKMHERMVDRVRAAGNN